MGIAGNTRAPQFRATKTTKGILLNTSIETDMCSNSRENKRTRNSRGINPKRLHGAASQYRSTEGLQVQVRHSNARLRGHNESVCMCEALIRCKPCTIETAIMRLECFTRRSLVELLFCAAILVYRHPGIRRDQASLSFCVEELAETVLTTPQQESQPPFSDLP
ncbi:hypothetical protein EJ08DRAFT_220169 [Tothia fuscella]|uniref:Uncharacterized protein n=1 Tax=Tothia fuscella TaxID=1048955 RepID=A0A9P4P219_9PEZI|nr:hypothetical protein EJ08DRAFT_220169 [Tothia fuscella]